MHLTATFEDFSFDISSHFPTESDFPMKLLLSLSLLTLLASCTGYQNNSTCSNLKNDPRYSSWLPCKAAPATNKGLCYVSTGVGQTVKTTVDVTDDSLEYSGQVIDRQARNYTNIGFNAASRLDDVAFRETNRYVDYGMDTLDDGSTFVSRDIRRWPSVGTKIVGRTLDSARKPYQATLASYGDFVDRSYFAFWNIFTPPEPKPYMVGSVNENCISHEFPGSSWRCRLPELPAEPVQETVGKNPGKNPVTASK